MQYQVLSTAPHKCLTHWAGYGPLRRVQPLGSRSRNRVTLFRGAVLSTAPQKWVTRLCEGWQPGMLDLRLTNAEMNRMPGPASPRRIVLSDPVRSDLVHLTRATTTAAGLARRARMVLLAADGVAI